MGMAYNILFIFVFRNCRKLNRAKTITNWKNSSQIEILTAITWLRSVCVSLVKSVRIVAIKFLQYEKVLIELIYHLFYR